MLSIIFTKLLLFCIFISKNISKLWRYKDLVNLLFIPFIVLICLIPAIFGNFELSSYLFYSFFYVMLFLFAFLAIFLVASIIYEKIFYNNMIPIKDWEEEIKNHTKNHESVDYLENEHCKLLFYQSTPQHFTIRICNKQQKSKIIEISTEKNKKNDKELLATIWLIIQTYFNKKTTIIGILVWILQINNFWFKSAEEQTDLKIYEI